jgi:ankyrin repeat protein
LQDDGETYVTVFPLLLAVTKGSTDMVKLLLSNKELDLNVTEANTGVNAFWLACYSEHWFIMQELANAGIDIYNTNRENINALHLSIYLNRPHIVKMLLKSNFSLEMETNKGYTCIHLCCILNRTSMLEMIMQHLKVNQFKRRYVKQLLNKINDRCPISALSFAII